MRKREDFMKINFTEKQYETLLKIVYMGAGIVNSVDESEGNKFTEIEEYIYSFAKNTGLENLVDYDEEEKAYYPSEALESDDEIVEYIQNYDDDTFWEKLIYNLAMRDMEHKFGKEKLEKMQEEDIHANLQSFAQKYEKEFSKNGIKNLKV
jgi:hypothetical protein